MRRALAITLVSFALVYFIALLRYAPPSPVSADAPVERFSAKRAEEIQRRLVGDGATRSIGTEGNAHGRAVIASELQKLGWLVETQQTWSCTFHGACAPVANVIGRLPGTSPGERDGVLVSAHHDSVPAGPGASDDGLGTVALLESARALAAVPRSGRTIVMLFTDGEESGLLGAEAFLHHPLAGSIGTTVNVDARGTRGPSQLFETSRGNRGLVALVGKYVERPVTTSLFYEIYKRMPNDTDFTLTKTIASGVNFANTAGIEHYHTPHDDLASSDLGTLQHHGDHVLAMTRALSESPSTALHDSSGDAVWFDVLATGLVQWPARWSMLLSLLALALVVGRAIRARVWDRGIAVIVSLVPGVLATLGVGWLLHALGALPAPWVAHPLPSLVALHLSAATAAVGTAFALARRSTPQALWAGTWAGWGLIGVALAAVAPGASYMFVVPTMVAALTGALPFAIACAAPAIASAILVLALATGLYDALGLTIAPVVALPTLLLATTISPLLAGFSRSFSRRVPLALGAGAALAVIVAAVVPTFSVARPQRVNVVFRQDDDRARVFVDTTWGRSTWGAPPRSMLTSIGGLQSGGAALPWSPPSTFVEVPRLPELVAPIAEKLDVLAVEDGGTRHVARVRLRSRRGASALALLLPADRQVEVKVAGHFAMPRSVTGGRLLAIQAVPKEGVVVEFSTRDSAGPVSFTLFDRSSGVPAGTKAADAVGARPSEGTMFQDGDQTIVATAVSL